MELKPGSQLGPYEILTEIGAGGMGQVWKAKDTRLGRYVAIKVLPAKLTADQGRRDRFFQEAKAASALNHPNIITIHDVGNEENLDFMVMEYVAGRQLEDVIPDGGLKLRDTLRYSMQIADALDKAHQAGIVHRDLKPANVMVTGDGLVKVLDFGLAKLTGMNTVDEAASDETRTAAPAGPLTVEGAVVGTVNYMSPEQAEGKPVDARSDVFSFGVLLYEMVTGKRAFHADTMVGTLSSILRDEPELPSAMTAEVPLDLEKLIQRCLRKEPGRRSQSMADVRVALEELKEQSDSGTLIMASAVHAITPVKSAPPRVVESAAPRGAPKWIWAVLAASVLALLGAGAMWWQARQEPTVVAPDLVQLEEDVRRATEITEQLQDRAQQRMEGRGRPPQPPPGVDPEGPPEGPPERFQGRRGGPDGPGDSRRRGPEMASRGEPRPAPAPIPTRAMLDRGLLDIKTDLWLLPVGSGTDRKPTRFLQDKAGLEPRFSPDGQRVAFMSAVEGTPEIWTTNIDGTGLKRLTATPGIGPRWSPDGRQIAFVSGSTRNSDIFLVNADGTGSRRLTESEGIERSPTWSRDSQHVYFGSNRTGRFEVWKKPAAGGEAEQITEDGGAEAFETPEGPGLLFVKQRPELGIYAKRASGTGLINPGGLEGAWTVNRDGIYFLGRANEPRPAIFFTRGQRWRPTVVAEIPGRLPRRRPGFDVSPDGEWVVVALEAVP